MRQKADSWTFLMLPKEASAKLPSRSMTAIEGTVNGFRFHAVAEPDGQRSHWLKVESEASRKCGRKDWRRCRARDLSLPQKTPNQKCPPIYEKLSPLQL